VTPTTPLIDTPLLDVRHATKVYGAPFGAQVIALQDFELAIPAAPARIVTVAGESGSGKSTLAALILGLVEPTSGEILFRGRRIDELRRGERRDYRRRVQAVFQDPYGVFNPFYRVRHVYDLVIRNFDLVRSRSEGFDLIDEALAVVGLAGAEVLDKYPHQLSGGQRQRLMMARAYMVKPDLIVADEPVSMVDASLRLMILEIMERMRDVGGISFVYITHDLSTAYQVSDEIQVLYQGVTVESGPIDAVLRAPKHPYVQMLIASIPDIDRRWSGEAAVGDEDQRGDVAAGCRFAPLCPQRMAVCVAERPALVPVESRNVACFLHHDVAVAKVRT
jgi:peptide/nickel transport system ATP-binding protein